jgi:hypothetical protein
MKLRTKVFCLSGLFLAACAPETPPTSVEEFAQDRVLLDATLARCDLEGSGSFDDRNCVNARRAVERLWREQEKINASLLEQESQRKLDLLRQQQDQEARLEELRRTEAEQKQQEELYQGMEFDGEPSAQAGTEESREPESEKKPDPH